MFFNQPFDSFPISNPINLHQQNNPVSYSPPFNTTTPKHCLIRVQGFIIFSSFLKKRKIINYPKAPNNTELFYPMAGLLNFLYFSCVLTLDGNNPTVDIFVDDPNGFAYSIWGRIQIDSGIEFGKQISNYTTVIYPPDGFN
jgi:hypothetical protein